MRRIGRRESEASPINVDKKGCAATTPPSMRMVLPELPCTSPPSSLTAWLGLMVPEVMRPVMILKVISMFFAIPQTWAAIKSMLRHTAGRLGAEPGETDEEER